MNPYQKLLERKRTWTPVQTTAGTVKEGAELVLSRALALRHMELPVGDFINDALASEVPEMARELLVSNVKDEEKHDLALGYIANAHGLMKRLRLRRFGYAMLGHRIQITLSRKQWWPNVQFFSFFYHSCALLVTVDLEQ